MNVSFKQLSIYRQALMGIAILYVFLFHTVTDWAPEWVYKVTSNGDKGGRYLYIPIGIRTFLLNE